MTMPLEDATTNTASEVNVGAMINLSTAAVTKAVICELGDAAAARTPSLVNVSVGVEDTRIEAKSSVAVVVPGYLRRIGLARLLMWFSSIHLQVTKIDYNLNTAVQYAE